MDWKDKRTVALALGEIRERLDTITDSMAWLIEPAQRFAVGQRVEWSRKGRRCGFPRRKVAQGGVVESIDGWSLVVKLDGLKKSRSFHHAYFNPVSGPKLF